MTYEDLQSEYVRLYAKYMDISEKVEKLTNDMAEVSWQWELLCTRLGYEVEND